MESEGEEGRGRGGGRESGREVREGERERVKPYDASYSLNGFKHSLLHRWEGLEQ